MEKIIVGIAEGKTAMCGQSLVSYALGSCVGVCLYDRERRIAGMAHIVLPEKGEAYRRDNAYEFADEAVFRLLEDMRHMGADPRHITAKIAGGARMFATVNRTWEIGDKNVAAVKKALQKAGIVLAAEDTGKDYGRTITFYADSGKMEIITVRHQNILL